MENKIIGVFEKLGLTRGELGRAAIEAGFNSANETAKAGLFQLVAGIILTGTGTAQGISGCKGAAELSKATELRNSRVAVINNNTLKEVDLPIESSDITVKVEALDKPNAFKLEEEISYAEETLSSKQIKPEKQTEVDLVEKTTVQDKMSEKKANKLIDKENKEYDIARDLIEAKKENFKTLGGIGQASYYISQGLGDVAKHQSQKDTTQKEVIQDSQNQIGNTADDLKRKVDKMIDFNPARSSSSSLRG